MADDLTKQTILYKTLSGLLAVQSSLYSNDLSISSAISSAFADGKVVIGDADGITSSAYSFRSDAPVYGTTYGNANYIATESTVTGYVNHYVNGVGNAILNYVQQNAYTSAAIKENATALTLSSHPVDGNSLEEDDQDRTLIIGLNTDNTTISQADGTLKVLSAGIWADISGAVSNVTPDVPVYSIETAATATAGYAKTYVFYKKNGSTDAVLASSLIDIPKDQFLLTSNFAWVSGDTTASYNATFSPADKPSDAYSPYLFLKLSPSGTAEPVSTWIPLADLMDEYTPADNSIDITNYAVKVNVKSDDKYLKKGTNGLYTTGIDEAITDEVTGTVSSVSGTLKGYIDGVTGVLKGYTAESAVSSAISSIVSDVSTINTKLGELAGNAANITTGEVLVADSSKHISGSNYTIGSETYSPVSSFGGASKIATESAVSAYVKSEVQIAQTAASDAIQQLKGNFGAGQDIVPVFADANGNSLSGSGFTIGGTTSATFEGSTTKLATESAVSGWVENGLAELYTQLTGLLTAIENGQYYPAP